MDFQYENSEEGFDSRYSIFAPKPINTATKQEMMIDFRPISQLSPGQNIEFNAPNTSLYYTDLSRTRLSLKVRILKADLTPIKEANKVGLINNAMHSIFRQVDVSSQQQNISPEIGVLYPYKSMIDALTQHSTSELDSKFNTELFSKDTAVFMDSVDVTTVTNKGLVARYEYTANGKVCMMEGVLKIDVMGIKDFIINGVSLNIKLYPAKAEFSLMTGEAEKYVLDITDATLKVCYIQPSNSLLIGHSEALERGPAIYPFTRSVLKSFTIGQGIMNWAIDTVFNSDIPDILYVCMVDSDSFNGDMEKNPFNFKTFDLDYLCLYIEGVPVNMTAFLPNYKTDHYAAEFRALFENRINPNGGDIISYSDFKSGYAIYKININNGVREEYNSLGRRGQSRLTFRFSKGSEKPIAVITYAQFPHILQIDKARNVIA